MDQRISIKHEEKEEEEELEEGEGEEEEEEEKEEQEGARREIKSNLQITLAYCLLVFVIGSGLGSVTRSLNWRLKRVARSTVSVIHDGRMRREKHEGEVSTRYTLQVKK